MKEARLPPIIYLDVQVSDYIICLIFAASILLLIHHRESFDPRVLRIIVFSIVLF